MDRPRGGHPPTAPAAPPLSSVLGKVVERPAAARDAAPAPPSIPSGPGAAAAAAGGGFPQAFHRESAGGSRFRQALVDAHSKRVAGHSSGGSVVPPGQRPAASPLAAASPLVSDSTSAGTGVAPGDLAAISASNTALVAGMSAGQLQEAVAEVTSLLSPATLAAWRAKRERAAAAMAVAGPSAAATAPAAASDRPSAARAVRWAPDTGKGDGDDGGLASLSASLSAAADDYSGPVFAGDASDALAALAEGVDINAGGAAAGGRRPLAPPQQASSSLPAGARAAAAAGSDVFDDAPPPGSVHSLFGRALAAAARERLGDASDDEEEGGSDGDDGAAGAAQAQRRLARASGASASSLPPHLLAAYLASSDAAAAAGAGEGQQQHPAAGLIRSLQAAAVATAGVDATGLHASAHSHVVDLRGRLVRQQPAGAASAACGHDHAADGSDACGAAPTAAADDGSAGLSLSQLCGLLRSRVPSQRAFAARAVTGLLRRRRAAFLGRASPPDDGDDDGAGGGGGADDASAAALPPLDWATVEAPALRALPLPPVLPVLLRCACDDGSLPALRWGLAALEAFLCPLPDELDAVACGVSEAVVALPPGVDGATATDAVATALALATNPPPPLVTAQPLSLPELASIDGAAGGVPLLLRNCDPADRVTAGASSRASAPTATGSLIRTAGESATDGLDCLTDPLTVLSHPGRMGLVDRLAAIVGGALAHLRPGVGGGSGGRTGGGGGGPSRPAPTAPGDAQASLLLPALRILTVVAQRSPVCAERVAGAAAPLPVPSRGNGGTATSSAVVPLLPLLADALLCTDAVTAAVRAAVGALARGDASLPVPSNADAASLSLAAGVAALLAAVVRSSRAAAAALCEREEGIEASGFAGARSSWPGRLTLETLVQFLPLTAVPAAAGEPSPPSLQPPAPSPLAPPAAATLPLAIAWRALSLLQCCWRYGHGLDLLPVVYAPAAPTAVSPTGSSRRHDNRPPEDAGPAAAAEATRTVGNVEPAAGSASASAAYVPPLPGLRVWTEGLADAAAEAALVEDDGEGGTSDGDDDAPATDVDEDAAAAAGFATLPERDATGAPRQATLLHLPHWRLLFGCGTLALLAAATGAAAVEAAGGHGLAQRLTAALSRRARREAAVAAAAAGDTDALAELRRGDSSGLVDDDGDSAQGQFERPEDVCAEATLLSSQAQAAVSHAVGATLVALLPAPLQAAAAPPPRQLAASLTLTLLASYFGGLGAATVHAVSVTTLTGAGLVTSSAPFPVALQRLLGTADGSGVGGAAPAPTSLAGLPSPLALAVDANGVGKAAAILACYSLLAPLLQSTLTTIDAGGAGSSAIRLRHLLPAVASLARAMTTRWPAASAAALATNGLHQTPAAALLVVAATASTTLSDVTPPALANIGTALPLALATAPSASGLATVLPVSCAPSVHWAASQRSVAAVTGALLAASAVSFGSDAAANLAAVSASLWEAMLPHCGPGQDAYGLAAVEAIAGIRSAVGAGDGASTLVRLLKAALLLSEEDTTAAGARELVPRYPSATLTSYALSAALPPMLSSAPLGLPAHPYLWRTLALQAALATAGAYDSLSSATLRPGIVSDDNGEGVTDVLILLQRSGWSPYSERDTFDVSLQLLASVDTLFQLLHVGLVPTIPSAACTDALRGAFDAVVRRLSALQCRLAPDSPALTALALLARHPRYGYRGDDEGHDDVHPAGDDVGDDDGTATGASTLLHALIRELVASYGRGAAENGAAALALAVLLQQQPLPEEQPGTGGGDPRAPLSVAHRRCAALRHAVWWELGRAGLTSRLVVPLRVHADSALARLLLHPPEADGRVLDAMTAALVAGEESGDDAAADDGESAGGGAAAGVPLLAIARHHLAHAVFAAPRSAATTAPAAGRLPFAVSEALRRFTSRGAAGRAALARLARWGLDDDGATAVGLRRFCSDGSGGCAAGLLPTLAARLARVDGGAA
jgi:hypothetical protein